jgi:nucleoside-diphosphate-sugar epimerase
MKIFLTGHNGFIGSHLQAALSDHDIEFLRFDLRDHVNVGRQLAAANPDVIVHLAARTEVEQSFSQQITFSEINYVGTVNLIEEAKFCGNLQRFVFASTMEVYGWQPVSDDLAAGRVPSEMPCFDEDTLACPNAPYAVAKLACENYIRYSNRAFDLPYTILRQTNCYGRIDNDFFVTERIISQMLQNPREIYLGDPLPWRNFIFIDDLIDAWRSVIRTDDLGLNSTYCVGPNNPIQIRRFADLIASKLDWHGMIHWNSRPPRPGEIYLLNSTNNKITQDLGWSPQVDLDHGLDLAIQRWKHHNAS